MGDDIEYICCDHLENGSPAGGKSVIPLGEKRLVVLCKICTQRIDSIIFAGVVKSAISEGVRQTNFGVTIP